MLDRDIGADLIEDAVQFRGDDGVLWHIPDEAGRQKGDVSADDGSIRFSLDPKDGGVAAVDDAWRGTETMQCDLGALADSLKRDLAETAFKSTKDDLWVFGLKRFADLNSQRIPPFQRRVRRRSGATERR